MLSIVLRTPGPTGRFFSNASWKSSVAAFTPKFRRWYCHKLCLENTVQPLKATIRSSKVGVIICRRSMAKLGHHMSVHKRMLPSGLGTSTIGDTQVFFYGELPLKAPLDQHEVGSVDCSNRFPWI